MKSTTRGVTAATRADRRRLPNQTGRARSCLECGICCDLYGHMLCADDSDRERWQREGCPDLLGRVGPGGRLWFDGPGTEPLDGCPYLVRAGLGDARCRIHETKPAMCRAYPTQVHGYRCVRGVRFDR